MTIEEILQFIAKSFGKYFIPDTLRHFLRSIPELKVIEGIPMDISRVRCPPENIDNYFDITEKEIEDIPCTFIFNTDETGFIPFVDVHIQKVVVPTEHHGNSVPYGVSRSIKRSTMIATICADGSYLKPSIVIQRKTIERELLYQGITSDNVQFNYTDTGFIDFTVFLSWAHDIFFPEIEMRRKKYSYNGPAYLFIDGCSVHGSDEFLDECVYRNIIINFFPAHSSDQLQMLDLGIFSILKTNQRRVTTDDFLSEQSKQIIKIISSWYASATPPNIVHSFCRAGYAYLCGQDEIMFLKVQRENAGNVRHFNFNPVPIDFDEMKERIEV